MRLILLNGPPRSGKDTASLAIEDWIADNTALLPLHEKFSWPNKVAFAAIMGRKLDSDFSVDYYEERKAEIVPEFGVSFRQFQIDFSEKFLKPLYGADVFAQLLLQRLEAEDGISDVAVISDCGFQIEVDALLSSGKFKPDEVLLIRCKREGTSFEGDSRQLVYRSDGGPQLDLLNEGTIEAWRNRCILATHEWLNLLGKTGPLVGD